MKTNIRKRTPRISSLPESKEKKRGVLIRFGAFVLSSVALWLTLVDASVIINARNKSELLTDDKISNPIAQLRRSFVRIPEGEFNMGSEEGDADERPVHVVRISSFEMGKHEVTQAQWEAVMESSSPSKFKGADSPVESVTWENVDEFIKNLNRKNDGYIYRLPTEAEWEYAYKAGSAAGYAKNMNDIAWYKQNSYEKTHTVGKKIPNKFKLYDMHGNVGEWCQDWYDKNYYSRSPEYDPTGPESGRDRVLRGSSWDNDKNNCRSSFRGHRPPNYSSERLGFRLVRTRVGEARVRPQPKPKRALIKPPVNRQQEVLAGLRKSFVRIPEGEFNMGSEEGDADERPVHVVRISSFEMGKHEVTQAQWEAVMGREKNHSHFKDCANCPVETVSWNEAQIFIEKLNALNDGYVYRLPTEAEWEYACRAGSKDVYVRRLDEQSWYANNSGLPLDASAILITDPDHYEKRILANKCRTHKVGTKSANKFGLFDMLGNVWEWCLDRYDSSYYDRSVRDNPQGPAIGSERIWRGGSWYNPPMYLRPTLRNHRNPDASHYALGFRLVRTRR